MKLYDEQLERAVLAGPILQPELAYEVAAKLETDDFYYRRHKLVFSSIVELTEAQVDVDLRTLSDHLRQRQVYDEVGGLALLAGLEAELPDLGRFATYVELLQGWTLRRRLHDAGEMITRLSSDGELAPREVYAAADELLLSAARGVGTDAPELGEQYADALERLRARADGLEPPSLETGFLELDRLLVSLVPGALVLLSARPRVGKSLLAGNLAAHAAFRNGKRVLFLSLEMTTAELIQRLWAAECSVPLGHLQAGRLSTAQWDGVIEMSSKTQAAGLVIDDQARMTLADVALKARRHRRRHGGLDLVIIDYLQLIATTGRSESRTIEVAKLSGGLKRIAKELEVPVLAISALSRAPEQRVGDHRPRLSDLSWSASLESDADAVVFLHREEIYDPNDPETRGIAEVIVAKQRGGCEDTVKLVFDGSLARFRTYDRREGDAF